MSIVIVIGEHRQSNFHNGLSCNEQHKESDLYSGMTCTDLWRWLINHVVSRNEMDKRPTVFLFHLYMEKKMKEILY